MARPPKYAIESVHAVGRYAVGVRWADRHDSIFPFVHLRRLCPCLECGHTQAVKREPAESERRLEGIDRVADASVLLHWADGHESLFLVEELREICGCAACKGEPTYPITGQ
jgi:DUF971 family protein